MEFCEISAEQTDFVHRIQATMAALEGHIEGLRALGSVRGAQHIELELAHQRRVLRDVIKEHPAVADAFSRLRRAETQAERENHRLLEMQRKRKREAQEAIAQRDAAVAELRETRRKIQDMETVCASRHAIKRFPPAMLGQGATNAGGPKAKKNRFEVLDRLARIRAGLSPGQKNDWAWFKEAWDREMVRQHGVNWGSLFAKWMQGILEDEATNAFSTFVYNETCRVFQEVAALHVPGG